MRGTTHTAIGITAVSMINNATIHSILTNPKGILPIVAAYVGALMCDIDTGSSTISNSLTIIKLRFFSRFITFMFLVTSVGALLYTRNTEYFKYVAALVIVAALSLSTFISDSYNVVKKVTLVGTAVIVIIMGMIYYMPPVIIIGVLLAALMFSPHRGYSHSLLAIIVCFGAIKYACITYNFYDISIYFGLGMLSHIIADMFTERGVALLFPYTKKIKFPITIKTGSPIEHLVTAISLVIFLYNFAR